MQEELLTDFMRYFQWPEEPSLIASREVIIVMEEKRFLSNWVPLYDSLAALSFLFCHCDEMGL